MDGLSFSEATKIGLEFDFENARTLTVTDLTMLKATIESLVDWHKEGLESNNRVYDSLLTSYQSILVKEDVACFVGFIQKTGNSLRKDGVESLLPASAVPLSESSSSTTFFSKIGQQMLFDIPTIESFEPSKNPALEEERKLTAAQLPRSLSVPGGDGFSSSASNVQTMNGVITAMRKGSKSRIDPNTLTVVEENADTSIELCNVKDVVERERKGSIPLAEESNNGLPDQETTSKKLIKTKTSTAPSIPGITFVANSGPVGSQPVSSMSQTMASAVRLLT